MTIVRAKKLVLMVLLPPKFHRVTWYSNARLETKVKRLRARIGGSTVVV